MIRESIKKAISGINLSASEMENTMADIIDGKATPAQVGAFVTALRMKGETIDEITGAARALNLRVLKLQLRDNLLNMDRDDINVEEETILDTCSTLENGTNTFNVSTATILVAAGGGVRVARHGNRTHSKYFGTADVLENLGVKLDISRSDVERCINEIGIGFMFAPLFHGLMQKVEMLRSQMGIRTIFNLIGPLANPAGAVNHVLGVYEPSLTEKIANVLERLDAGQAFVVYGEGTYDEISICGQTRVSHLKNGSVETFMITPEQYGFDRADRDAIRGGNVRQNAEIIRDVLAGSPGPRRDIVELNAAAAFVAAGLDDTIKDGITRAKDVIESGKAGAKLDALIEFTNYCSPFERKELS